MGSPVFHVMGTDPDDPYTPAGQIQYSFLRDSTDADTFNIGMNFKLFYSIKFQTIFNFPSLK